MTVGLRTRFALLVALVALAFTSCGGGGGSVGSAGFDCAGDSTGIICLEQCNLGCSTTGCSRTDIAQNEIIILTFSEDVDPNSVNESSIRFRTASGDEPVGEFFVNGARVEFVPTLSISGGQTFFGFTGGETYTMTIVGGTDEPAVVRGTTGRPFGATLTCTLQSTLGIVDLNQIPPSATLVVPTSGQLLSAPLDTEIRIEFNELIDATPFLTGTQSPVAFTVRRTRSDGNGGFECDPESNPQVLGGSQQLTFDASRGVSVLNFVPSQDLPGNVCVEVSVTDGVTDLSGRPAQPQVFVFRTVIVPLSDFEIIEEFDDNLQLDVEASAGKWESGLASFAKIGGDGRHGVWTTANAVDKDQVTVGGKRVFEMSCDNTIIPPENTTTGSAIAITDGRFFFSTMVIPGDVSLRFVGSSPPVLTVAGRFDVQGEIEVMGQPQDQNHGATSQSGQAGAVGGIFGGSGGQGGDRCNGVVGAIPANNGRPGQSANVIGGHGYISTVSGTGGRGSQIYPASGLNASQQFGIPNPAPSAFYYCLSAGAGGSGGGLRTAGGDGFVEGVFSGTTPIANMQSFIGGPTAGGSAMQLFPFPAPSGLQKSSQHFLAGGAGGGGAASGCSLSLALNRTWSSGAGGGGGAGAIGLRAGSSLRLGPGASLLATGGSALDYLGTSAGSQVLPGGGGSGGSVVLQSGGVIDIIGEVNVEGGAGGYMQRQGSSGVGPIGGIIKVRGGDGSPGFVRLEAPIAPPLSALATTVPAMGAESVAALTEVDDLVSMRSLYYTTNLIFGPQFSHYEIDATVDGQAVTFSDNIEVSSVAAGVGAPVRALFQAANVDVVTGEILAVRPWRTSVRSSPTQTGIASDGLNGFRFMLFFDQTLATSLTIDRVVVVYRN
ncbi:MAG: hypothetical protein ACI89X_000640 [Planctomycetota bacterium]|jgi:hypothetical protein